MKRFKIAVRGILRFTAIAGGVFIFGAGFLRSVENGVYRVEKPLVEPEAQDAATLKLFEFHKSSLEKQLSTYSGKNLWSVDVENIAAMILKNSWVSDVNVQRRIPNLLRVRVTPKQVSAVFLGEKSNARPVASDGSLLPEMPAAQSPDVPLLRQNEFLEKKELRQKALAILEQLPKEGRVSRSGVSEVSIDKQNAFWLSLIQKDVQVRIGENNVGLRAARIERVLDYLETNNLQARVIDADFSKKVIVKPRKAR